MAAPKDHEDPLVSPAILVTVVGLLVLVISIFGLHAIYYGMEKREEHSKLHQRDYIGPLDQFAKQEEQLASWRYVEFDRQLVAIPIEEAMRLEAARLEMAREK